MDLNTTVEKLPLDGPEKIKGTTLYKVVFKNNIHTILPYEILIRFELIKTLIDEYKPHKLDIKEGEYPVVNLTHTDIVYFMGMIIKMLQYSNNNKDLLDRLDYNERNVYDYLITDKDYNDDIIKINKELLDIISATIEVYLLDKKDNIDTYNISTTDIRFKNLCNKYSDDNNIKVEVDCDDGEYFIYINIDCIVQSYTKIFSNKHNCHYNIYNGFFKPLNRNVYITSDYRVVREYGYYKSYIVISI
jgi:hypothetical protein